MDEKNLSTILEALAEKISSLEFELRLCGYENEKLKEENEKLRYHLNPLAYIKKKETDNA